MWDFHPLLDLFRSISLLKELQCRAPDPAGRAADDAEGPGGVEGHRRWEEATGAGKWSGHQGASRRIGEGQTRGDKRKRPGTTERPEDTTATGYRREREEEGGRRRDG